MKTKITTAQQVDGLRAGDVITRFPTNGAIQDLFDDTRIADISTFSIQNINAGTGILSLITVLGPDQVLTVAGDRARLFIKPGDLVTERTWWVSKDNVIAREYL